MRTMPEFVTHLDAVVAHGIALAMQPKNEGQRAAYMAWFPRALHVIDRLTPEGSHYRSQGAELVRRGAAHGYAIYDEGMAMVAMLGNLKSDLSAGMFDSLVEIASADVLDNVLDTARQFHKQGRKEGGGVLAGVVFEDTMRRMHRKHVGDDAGTSVENVIQAMTKAAVITPYQADKCRAAAKLRTSAAHARWDEFDLRAVGEVIEETHQLLMDHFPH